MIQKKLKNLILKKRKISGVAQKHFFNNFANSCAHLVANFLNTPNIYNLMILKEVMDKKKQKNQKSKNMPF